MEELTRGKAGESLAPAGMEQVMDFKRYYGALIAKKTRTEPRADEALQDYQASMRQVFAGIAVI